VPDYIHTGVTFSDLKKNLLIDIRRPISIPKKWTTVCRDVKLGVSYDPQVLVIHSKPTGKVQVSLTAPPHQIHGNDTITIQWKANNCTDCFKFTPNQLSFNSENFQIQQTINITRLKSSPIE
jgi:hypothetical protein